MHRILLKKIKVGSVYKFDDYYVDRNKDTYRVVPYIARIKFAHKTVFTLIIENISDIPQNKFNFIEFGQLWGRVNVNEVLSGNILNPLYSFNTVITSNLYSNTFFL